MFIRIEKTVKGATAQARAYSPARSHGTVQSAHYPPLRVLELKLRKHARALPVCVVHIHAICKMLHGRPQPPTVGIVLETRQTIDDPFCIEGIVEPANASPAAAQRPLR